MKKKSHKILKKLNIHLLKVSKNVRLEKIHIKRNDND